MIENYGFGRITIHGKTYTEDILITPSREIVPQWWRKKGHRVDFEDVAGILKNTRILVLGKGKPGLMKASNELKAYLDRNGIELVEKPSAKAAEIVNRMVKQDQPFAAGFHLTC